MNETLNVIEQRRSIRAYSNLPISANEKETILHAAMRAPTAGNMMLYSIIDVTDSTLKNRLAETCDHQPFIAKAPLVLVFLADYQRWHDFYVLSGAIERSRELNLTPRTPAVGDLMLAVCDALIAAQNAVIAAESLGIGSCYIGDILENYEIHRELFNLPPYTVPISMLCFGKPAQATTANRPIARFDKEFIVHENSYHSLNAEEYARMFGEMQARFALNPAPVGGAQNVGQGNYLRKFISEFSVEMNRSVKEMLKNWE